MKSWYRFSAVQSSENKLSSRWYGIKIAQKKDLEILYFGNVGTYENDQYWSFYYQIVIDWLSENDPEYIAKKEFNHDNIDLNNGRDFLKEKTSYSIIILCNLYNPPESMRTTDQMGDFALSDLHTEKNWSSRLAQSGAKYIFIIDDGLFSVVNRIPGYTRDEFERAWRVSVFKKDSQLSASNWYKIQTAQKQIMIPEKYQQIINELNTKAKPLGIKVYAVGGFVRDLIMGRTPKDLDVMADIENPVLYQRHVDAILQSLFSSEKQRIDFVQSAVSGAKKITQVIVLEDSFIPSNKIKEFIYVKFLIDYIDNYGKKPIKYEKQLFETTINPSYLLSSQFGNRVPRGEIFGIYAINTKDVGEIEIAYPRSEEYDAQSRKPRTEIGTFQEDAHRRDFGMNALYIDLQSDQVLDPTGHGIKDIQDKTIKISDPSAIDIIFKDDPLRILRSIRFATTLGFSIDQQIIDYIKQNPHLMTMKEDSVDIDEDNFVPKLSSERIAEEFRKIMSSGNPVLGLRLMKDLNIFHHVVPLSKESKDWGLDQKNPHHYQNVWEHTLNVLNQLQGIIQLDLPGIDKEHKFLLNVAALLHDIGKLVPISGHQDKFDDAGELEKRNFSGHDVVSYDESRRILSRLKMSNSEISVISGLIKYHDEMLYLKNVPIGSPDYSKKIAELSNALGKHIYDLLILCRADRKAHIEGSNDDSYLIAVENDLDENKFQYYVNLNVPMVNGDELQSIFADAPGRWIGIFQRFLVEMQKTQLVQSKDEAIVFAQKISTATHLLNCPKEQCLDKIMEFVIEQNPTNDRDSIAMILTKNFKALGIKPLLNGDEIIEIMNIEPGPWMSGIVQELIRKQIFGEVVSKEDAIDFVKQYQILA